MAGSEKKESKSGDASAKNLATEAIAQGGAAIKGVTDVIGAVVGLQTAKVNAGTEEKKAEASVKVVETKLEIIQVKLDAKEVRQKAEYEEAARVRAAQIEKEEAERKQKAEEQRAQTALVLTERQMESQMRYAELAARQQAFTMIAQPLVVEATQTIDAQKAELEDHAAQRTMVRQLQVDALKRAQQLRVEGKDAEADKVMENFKKDSRIILDTKSAASDKLMAGFFGNGKVALPSLPPITQPQLQLTNGYPQQQIMGGYPQQQIGGYPQQQIMGGYPQQQQIVAGYSSQMMFGAPPQGFNNMYMPQPGGPVIQTIPTPTATAAQPGMYQAPQGVFNIPQGSAGFFATNNSGANSPAPNYNPPAPGM